MVKPVYSGERKKFGLSYFHKPMSGYPVSGVVKVVDEEGKGYTYIRFSSAFVEAVGKAMPYGVSADNPCYLQVICKPPYEKWEIYARYLDESRARLLWLTDSRPVWLVRVKRGKQNG